MAGKRKELTEEEIAQKELEEKENLEILKYDHPSIFDENGEVIKTDNIICEPRESSLLAYCPFLTELKIAQKYAGYFAAYFNKKPLPIANVNWNQSDYVYVCWLMINKNLRDVFETQTSKGKNLWTVEELKKTMKNPELTAFANFDILDETEQVKCNVNRFKYPIYKDEIFLSWAEEVFLIYWRNGTTFRSITVNKIFKLEPLLKKISEKENLTKDELEILRFDLRKKYVPDQNNPWTFRHIYKGAVSQPIENMQNQQEEVKFVSPSEQARPVKTSNGTKAFVNPFG